jgi:hypothetical protein
MNIAEAELNLLDWRKARRSMGNGDCVEVAAASRGVLVRDSKNPSAAVLGYPATAWRSFLVSAKLGNFDGPGSLLS